MTDKILTAFVQYPSCADGEAKGYHTAYVPYLCNTLDDAVVSWTPDNGRLSDATYKARLCRAKAPHTLHAYEAMRCYRRPHADPAGSASIRTGRHNMMTQGVAWCLPWLRHQR